MEELKVQATVENIPAVTEFIDTRLEALGCPMRAQIQLDVAIDELFGNIAYYAYRGTSGMAAVRFEALEKPRGVRITFEDSGVPYNPLEKEDPDVTLSAEERKIGGLGIFLVKKSMDGMTYEYREGHNVLAITKLF